MAEPILQVENLTMHYQTRQGEVKAVDGVSFTLERGQSLGLVGESGCGKTSVAATLMKLLPDNARLLGGRILLDGHDLVPMDDEEIRHFRWKRVAMVFQAAMNALDPVYRVGEQIVEAIETHGLYVLPEAVPEGAEGQTRATRETSSESPGSYATLDGDEDWDEDWDEDKTLVNRATPIETHRMNFTSEEAQQRVEDLFRLVGLDPALTQRYPHELSGGMRQRAIIAMALVCQPDLIIADEPTTALDVIVQDRILGELKRIQRELNMSMIYITHDIAVIAEVTDHLGVMYAGKLVEYGGTAEVFRQPIHPYTAALLSSFPSIHGEKRELVALGGEPPNLIDPPTGCRFHPRCPYATEVCQREEPPVVDREGRWAACWHPLA